MEQLETRLTTISEEFKRFLHAGLAELRFPFDNREYGLANDYGRFGTDDGSLVSHQHPASVMDDDTAMNVVQEPTTPPRIPPIIANDSLFSGSPTTRGFSVPPARPESLMPVQRQSTPSDWSALPVMSPANQFEELPDETAEPPSVDRERMAEETQFAEKIGQQTGSAEDVTKLIVDSKEVMKLTTVTGDAEDKMEGVETSHDN